MNIALRFVVSSFATAVLLLQGCSLVAPKEIDPVEQQVTLERYKRCMQRFEIDAIDFCAGHRRDVLAIYPSHMQDHVDTLLTQKFDKYQVKALFKNAVSDNSL